MKIFMWAALFFCSVASGLSVAATVWFYHLDQIDLAWLWAFCAAISLAMGALNATVIDKLYKD